MKNKRIFFFSVFLIFLAFVALSPDIAFAADEVVDSSIADQENVKKFKASFDATMGTNFSNNLSDLYIGFQSTARIIVVLMTALAGIMIAFGLGGANQMFFKWIFGIGMVANFAQVGWDLFGDYWINADPSAVKVSDDAKSDLEAFTKIHPASEAEGHTFDVFSSFMNYYSQQFITPAYQRIMPIAVKLTMVLWFIDTSMKIALGLTQQDLINFFTKQIIKLGIYIFLITNWWSAATTGPNGNSNTGGAAYTLSKSAGGNMQLMSALGTGFESLGYYAAGGSEMANSDGKKIALQANNIYENSFQLWSALWASMSNADVDTWKGEKAPTKTKEEKGFLGGAVELVKGVFALKEIVPMLVIDIILLLAMMVLLLLIAIEMFMVRLEFYTMAVLTVLLLPFAMIDQLKFLADKAISLMFNLAIKCFVIAFISVAIVKILQHYIQNDNVLLPWFLDIGIVLQLGAVIMLLFLLVKKVPQLCNSLLSGNPSLSGGDLMGQIASTMKAVGTGAAALATGGAAAAGGAAAGAAAAKGGTMAKALGGIKGGLSEGLGAMGRGIGNYALTQNPMAQGFKQGMNLFSGNGESKGLMQRGATSQHLGLYTPSTKEGLMDRMNPSSTDDKSKNDSGSTNNNNGNNNNQGVSLAKGNEGEKTIEKQIGTIKESMDRIEKMLSNGNPPSGGNNLTNSGNSSNNNGNPVSNAGNLFNNASSHGNNNVNSGNSSNPLSRTENSSPNPTSKNYERTPRFSNSDAGITQSISNGQPTAQQTVVQNTNTGSNTSANNNQTPKADNKT